VHQADVATVPSQKLERTPDDSDAFHKRFVWLLTILGGVSLWLRPMTSALWMDELGSWWVVKDSFTEAVQRSWTFQGESPLYYALLWLDRHVLGASEWALRVPSFLAMIGSVVFLYLLARRLLDAEFGRLAVLAAVVSFQISFQAANARPYALGLLGVTGSMYLLVRWMDDGAVRYALGYVAMAVVTAYAHYLLCLAFIPQLIYVVARKRDGTTRVRGRDFAVAIGALGLLLAPLAGQLGSLWARRASLTLPVSISVEWFTELTAPAAVVTGFIIGWLVASLAGGMSLERHSFRSRGAVLLVGSVLVPLAAIVFVSAVSSLNFGSARYALAATPAEVLLVAWVVRCVEPAMARRVVAAALVIVAVIDFGGPTHTPEDWRTAAARERSIATERTVLLLHPQLVEAAQLDWFRDAERRSYLLSPMTYYDMGGRVLPVPYMADADSKQFLLSELEPLLAGADQILYLTRDASVPFAEWLDGRLSAMGWSSETVGTFGDVVLMRFIPPASN
jgi:mannosyltransferase